MAAAAFCLLARVALCLPLICVGLLFAGIAVIGVARLPAAELVTLPAQYGRAATTAVVCLALGAPAAAFRMSLLWLLPLGATAAAGAAGWTLLPVAPGTWPQSVEGAVLLLPVMVLVLRGWWRRIPPEIAETVMAAGGSPLLVFFKALVAPALPGVARGLAVVFVLALGLGPLLAPASGNP